MGPVMIDPGHGGRDPGAVASGLREKQLNLEIALALAGVLAGLKTDALLTRENDLGLSLKQRCEIADNSRAALFLSIHCNASENPQARGIELFHDPGSARGQRLAESLHRELLRFGRRDRGVKPAAFFVLKHTSMPACLVECGFISNPGEAAWLKASASAIAQALADGIKAFPA